VLAYYWLKADAAQPLKLELLDGGGAVRACAASDTPVQPVDTEAISVQAIWQQPTLPPSAAAGMHRFAIGGASGRGFGFGGRAATAPTVKDACTGSGASAQALQAGEYTLRLTVDGQTYTQPVTLKPDPRLVH
jgi:hypothetical protein